MVVTMRTSRKLIGTMMFLVLSICSGCSSEAFNVLNPYDVTPETELGERTNKALLGDSGNRNEIDEARRAAEVMGAYRRAQAPQPIYPVRQPGEVRLMWIPDHLNQFGDLVPAHYYFLKVLDERWAVQDGAELQEQLKQAGASGGGTITPFVYGKPRQ